MICSRKGDNAMEKYGVNELRRKYLEFFESKGHLAMKSFSLVPHNDNSLLLINAGMAPLKPYFTGQDYFTNSLKKLIMLRFKFKIIEL